MASQRDGGVSWSNPPGYWGESWNVVRGCAERCGAQCWAERQAIRQAKPGEPYAGLVESTPTGPRWTGKQRFVTEKLAEPLHWREPRCIAVSLMGDLFGSGITNEGIAAVYGVMAACPQHRFVVVTKQAQRRLDWHGWLDEQDPKGRPLLQCNMQALNHERERFGDHGPLHLKYCADPDGPWPLANVVELVSCSDQATVDDLVPILLRTPAAWRGLSLEPQLGAADLSVYLRATTTVHLCADVAGLLRNRQFGCMVSDDGRGLSPGEAEAELNSLLARGVKVIKATTCDDFDDQKGCRGHRKPGLDWIIVGPETGPRTRPCDVEWIRSVVRQCQSAGVPVHVKAVPVCKLGRECMHVPGICKQVPSKKPEEWPEDLRVREAVPR